ncbi:hypothetical protein [Pengzhenrongella sicca]|uniref:Uncharacterized protein n=1 Tax=Pengzhenrongella sicca TaxID=2819238 RepID=A0A8A4ZE92_9MICO|nr:hypothetical protein [Pengzhenrongella sicca]QTE30224.1 hypothetical protein J4E96_04245 [Pengzhenrongella sicca]
MHRQPSTPTVTPRRRRRRQATLATAAVLVAALVHLVAQAGMMLRWAGWHPSMFRNYYWSDQLAYLAIASNAANGNLSAVEPLTMTGSNYYPRAYYLLLGLAADATSTSVATMWTVLGLAAQVMLVVAIGATCVLLTRRWWTGLLGFTPFMFGTFSWLVSDSWMTTLDSHAVLWGPFGVIYTLNGESVALCLAGVALLALLLVGAGRVPERAAWPVAVAACLLIGALANVQTYSFLVAVYMLAGGAAAVGLVRERSRIALLATAVALVVVLALGPAAGARVSPLAVLVLGLLPMAPGLVVLARATRWRLLWCVAAVAVGAAPQVLGTVFGILGGDAFLTYRESSSKDLGVSFEAGLVAAGVILPALAFIAMLGVRHRRTLWLAVPVASVAVWALLATNDRWGANQEPYRFWLDVYVLVAVLTVPLGAWAALEAVTSSVAHRGPADDPSRANTRPGSPPRAVVVVALVVVVAWAGAGIPDWIRFRADVASAGYLQLSSPLYVEGATISAAAEAGGGSVLTDMCIDPLFFKVNWGGSVAAFNRGLAWPDEVEALDQVLHMRASGVVDEAAARTAGARWLLTSTACAPALAIPATAERITSGEYPAHGADPAGTVTLWRLQG